MTSTLDETHLRERQGIVKGLKEELAKRLPQWLLALAVTALNILHPNRSKTLFFPCGKYWLVWKNGYIVHPPPYYGLDCYELDTFYYDIMRGDIVLDVGAGVGKFAIPAARDAGREGLVVAIEPERENLTGLRRSASRFNNIQIVEECAWKRKEKVKLYLDEKPGGHSLVKVKGGRAVVQADTLDNMVAELGISRADFIKIDVEGAELEVLEGAKKILKNTRNMVVECHLVSGKLTRPRVQRFLEANGFKIIATAPLFYDKIVYAQRRPNRMRFSTSLQTCR